MGTVVAVGVTNNDIVIVGIKFLPTVRPAKISSRRSTTRSNVISIAGKISTVGINGVTVLSGSTLVVDCFLVENWLRHTSLQRNIPLVFLQAMRIHVLGPPPTAHLPPI